MKILNKCPICGGKLEYNTLCQYTNVYYVKKNGDLTKQRKRKEDNGPMDCSFSRKGKRMESDTTVTERSHRFLRQI